MPHQHQHQHKHQYQSQHLSQHLSLLLSPNTNTTPNTKSNTQLVAAIARRRCVLSPTYSTGTMRPRRCLSNTVGPRLLRLCSQALFPFAADRDHPDRHPRHRQLQWAERATQRAADGRIHVSRDSGRSTRQRLDGYRGDSVASCRGDGGGRGGCDDGTAL